MNMDILENTLMLLAAVMGLLISLFRFIETPRRGYLYLSVFCLAHVLSDYYWAIYLLVVHQNPEISAMIAYFGWNAAYVFLLLAAIHMREEGAGRYFHPLMLLPIPWGIWQFFLYSSFGVILNNLWSGLFATLTMCLCLQSILYYLKNRRKGASSPAFHLVVLGFLITEYGMWTSSCFTWESDLQNPYYWFALLNCLTLLLLPLGASRTYVSRGLYPLKKNAGEIDFQVFWQVFASAIILAGCISGYFIASWMQRTLPPDNGSGNVHEVIAMTLFIISVVLVVIILAVLLVISSRYKALEKQHAADVDSERNSFGSISTALITFGLMIFSVVYTSRLFYQVTVTGLYESGTDRAELISTELGNYLSDAASTLQVSSDTVDFMVQKGESQKQISEFLTFQTNQQFQLFDENFTGIYAFVRGEYMDGSGWIPPDNYDATARDWYNKAVAARGETVIVPPYVDAQTKSVVITICRLISDDAESEALGVKNVVALDVIVNHIQDVIEDADINGKGYGMILDRDGRIIAHRDRNMIGSDFKKLYGKEFFAKLSGLRSGVMDLSPAGENSMLFVAQVMGQWHIVINVSDEELFEDVRSQLSISIFVSLMIFALISLFYYLGYRNQQQYMKQMEEMRISRQKQEYEAQVLKLEKMAADEANKAKSSFLADMSHEIRTPINAILGMNEMILREAEDPALLEYSGNIAVAGKNLLHLVNSVLDFSKIEDGKMEILPERYSVNSLVSYLVNSITERSRKKELQLMVNVEPSLPAELYGDDSRIAQVIMNILTNAVKYTEKGYVALTIRQKERTGDRILLYVEVKDSGIGIRESDMERLFQSFERLDVEKNRNIEGTGLGMAITAKLLGLMDSELKVESVYGRGSTFYFELWQGIRSEEPLGNFSLTSGGEEIQEAAEGILYAPKAHILAVDDTRTNLFVVKSLLKRTAIRIDTAGSGEEAVRLAENNDYDMILMDQRMPGMDGTEAMKAIRRGKNSLNLELPIICLTADAIRGAKDKYLEEGFTDYLTKPVDGKALERMLARYLPKEKQEKRESGEKEKKQNILSDDPLFEALEQAGVDPERGMAFCQKDEGIYREILSEFASESVAHRKTLQDAFAGKDWETYLIRIHSLKSTAKTIGAERLSAIAASLEAAAGEGNEALIMKDHLTAMDLYGAVVSAVMKYMEVPEEGTRFGDGEVLEFAPVEKQDKGGIGHNG